MSRFQKFALTLGSHWQGHFWAAIVISTVMLLGGLGSLGALAQQPTFPDVYVYKYSNLSEVKAGEVLTYFIRYGSEGLPAQNVVLTDTLPQGMNFVSATPLQPNVLGNMLIWNLGDVPTNSAILSQTLVVQLDAGIAPQTILTNVVEIGSYGDANPQNNIYRAGVKVITPIPTATPTCVPGQTCATATPACNPATGANCETPTATPTCTPNGGALCPTATPTPACGPTAPCDTPTVTPTCDPLKCPTFTPTATCVPGQTCATETPLPTATCDPNSGVVCDTPTPTPACGPTAPCDTPTVTPTCDPLKCPTFTPTATCVPGQTCATETPHPSATPTPACDPTHPCDTPTATPTCTPNTGVPCPTNTPTPAPTATCVPGKCDTPTATPTCTPNTGVPCPTNTPTPAPTATCVPGKCDTPTATPTCTPNGGALCPTNTPTPTPTATCVPDKCDTPTATATPVTHASPTPTPIKIKPTGLITGIVISWPGTPLPHIYVSAILSTSHISKSRQTNDTGYYGWTMSDASGRYTITNLMEGPFTVYFSDSSQQFIPQYYQNTRYYTAATAVMVVSNTVISNVNATLQPMPTPIITVTSNGSSMQTNPDNGQVTIVSSSRKTDTVKIMRHLTCPDGTFPNPVVLFVSGQPFTMTHIGGGQYEVVINTPTDLLTIPAMPHQIELSYTCGNQVITEHIGEWHLYDPSGFVTDANTHAPIDKASVTLYRVPNALPDKNGQTNQCRTIDTRPISEGGIYGMWSGVPAAELSSGQLVDPQADAALFEPQLNSQLTTAEGHYAWNVAEGCWFVYVQANGYQSLVSPLVGVPPEVTDLNLALTPLEKSEYTIYLPIILRK